MTAVRTSVPDGFVEISGPGISAVVEVAERHVDALTAAAAEGLVPFLDLLCSRGLLVLPAFGVVATDGPAVRAILRGVVRVELKDGRVLAAEEREPWADVDVPDPGAEITLAAPEPEPVVARGWRRPARLGTSAAAVPAAAAPEPDPDPDPAPVPEPTPTPEQGTPAVPPADLTLPPPAESPGASPADRVPPGPAPDSALIDSVPWRRAGGAAAHPAAPAPAAPATAALPATEPGAPDGEPAAAPVPEEQPAVPDVTEAAPPEPAATETPAEPAPVEVTTARASLPRNDEDLDRPVVLAVLCPAGHHSPPHAGHCRGCGRAIPPQQPVPIPRPALGVLRISTGGVVTLDRGVLLGRAPRVNEELAPSQRPHLIRVGSVDRDISRNHAEVVLEGWHVLVRDLGSTNGTTVTLPGEEPVRLRPTEDQGIEPGAVITLADEVSLTYEVDA
ncbi:FHA domain-containing protein [uncultured Phycicoccus sp.]|uniref:FHA domain-containing protein n=1 Tax=uncultured Phycicoccus sp. TaxID=661422 RepID=UPI00262611E0|nr:FHA domain-containing protein [uncultured Phycicoccus sp.]